MDIQNKKNKMVDIMSSKEVAKPIIHLENIDTGKDFNKKSDIESNIYDKEDKQKIFINKQAKEAEILSSPPAFNQNQLGAVSVAEIKNPIVEIDKKDKTIDFAEEIFKKSKKEEPLLLQEKKNFIFKKIIVYFFIILITAISLYAAIYILPRAEITITTKKSAWNFNNVIGASKDVSNIDMADKQIPAEIFKDVKTLTLSFPAHGKKFIERKAIGEVVIYNSYSSQSQTLVVGTRIESPDGKIFRLDKKIIVPGAKIEEGKILASSVKAMVTAEKAGEEYNIASSNRFTIPGLKGSAKYDGFYAISSEAMKGGLVGDILFPTEEDIFAAKKDASEQLFKNMDSFILSQFNDDFKIFGWSKIFNITKENIDKEADKNGNFLISLEGELRIIAFKESDVLKLMSKEANQVLGQNFEIKNYKLNYGSGQYNADNGKMVLNIEFNGEFWQPINIENFKNSVINKKENDLKVFVFSIPGVEKATFSLWPGWVKKVPNSANKIKVNIN